MGHKSKLTRLKLNCIYFLSSFVKALSTDTSPQVHRWPHRFVSALFQLHANWSNECSPCRRAYWAAFFFFFSFFSPDGLNSVTGLASLITQEQITEDAVCSALCSLYPCQTPGSVRCLHAAWAPLMNTPVLTEAVHLRFMTRPWWVLCNWNELRKGPGSTLLEWKEGKSWLKNMNKGHKSYGVNERKSYQHFLFMWR